MNRLALAGLLLGVSTLLVPESAQCFEMDTHAEISKTALSASSLAEAIPGSGTTWEFTGDAKDSIASANKWVDKGSLGGILPGTAPFHFDDSLMHEGADRLIEKRAEVLAALEL